MRVTALARGVPALALLAGLGNAAWAQPRPSSGDKARLDRFEQQVESVRGRLKTPGLSVAIVKDQELRAIAPVAVHVGPETLESYVGQYQFEALDNRIFTVTREGDRLFVTLPSTTELFAESESKFFLKTRPYKFVFAKAHGQDAQLEIVEGGDTFRSKRIK